MDVRMKDCMLVMHSIRVAAAAGKHVERISVRNITEESLDVVG
jgi:hypothetical protein